MLIFDRDMLRNRGPTSDFVGYVSQIVADLASGGAVDSLLNIVVIPQHCFIAEIVCIWCNEQKLRLKLNS